MKIDLKNLCGNNLTNIPTFFVFLFVQVHPYKLTKALFESARLRGVKLVTGKVEGIEFEEENQNISVKGKQRKELILLNL